MSSDCIPSGLLHWERAVSDYIAEGWKPEGKRAGGNMEMDRGGREKTNKVERLEISKNPRTLKMD